LGVLGETWVCTRDRKHFLSSVLISEVLVGVKEERALWQCVLYANKLLAVFV